jgi:hypothetical protein
MTIRYIRTNCAGCGVTFAQPDDPGRKRRYHDDACKQRAYRERKAAAEARRQAEAGGEWARTWDSIRRRAGRQAPGRGPEAKRERARRIITALRAKAASTTFAGEAILCEEKADELAERYGV